MILRAQVDADKSAGADLSGTRKDMGSFYLQSWNVQVRNEFEQSQRMQNVDGSPAQITQQWKTWTT